VSHEGFQYKHALSLAITVSIGFARGDLEYLWVDAFGKAEYVDHPMNACLGCLHGIKLVMDGRHWTRRL
jgi:hypothetical protein